jgi:RpiR family carbohydrate utilization transcriptional regulator
MVQNSDAPRGDLLAELKIKINALTPSERGLAEYVIEQFDQISTMPGGALADACGVSKATLTRFVRRFGYKSYRAFQIDVARTGRDDTSSMVYSDITYEDNPEAICRKVYENNIRALMDTLSVMDFEKMTTVANMILNCRAMYVFAQGRSEVVAKSLVSRFYRLGINCFKSSDPHTQAVYSSLVGPEDLVVGISTFGRSRSVLRAMERAKTCGAHVLGLTSFQNTPMEKHAQIVLCAVTNHKSGQEYEPSSETISQILLIDCLYMLLVTQRKEKAKQCFVRTQRAIDEERV